MAGLRELELFAGAGGGILGGMLLGHRPVCAVEYDAYARSVLLARQADGTFPPFPVWDDVRTFRGEPWRGIVDVVSGGFPCQDISVAGTGAGIEGERSGLWREMARIIGEVRPRYVFVENSPALVTRGLGAVLGDLAALGFDARWTVLGASDVGAPHKRERIWILAHSEHGGVSQRRRVADAESQVIGSSGVHGYVRPCVQQQAEKILAHANGMWEQQPQGSECNQWRRTCNCGCATHLADSDSDSAQGLVAESQPREYRRQIGLHGGAGGFPAWPADPADAVESRLDRVANGVAHRTHRLKAIGNGQVPRVRAAAWRMLDVWGGG